LVRRRAKGRCEYCRTPFRYDFIPAEVDHILSRQHGGKTTSANLAMACAHCNSHKGPNIAGFDPRTSQIVALFNPREHHWNEHFQWVSARLQGKTPQGRATITVLAINHPIKLIARAALMHEGVF
jgi:hypothetical protein